MVRQITKIAILILSLLHADCNHSEKILANTSISEKCLDMVRFDGYYYRIDSSINMVEVFLFFKNGKLLHNYFENERKLNAYFNKNEIILRSQYAWGAFNCIDDKITIEYYVPKLGNELSARWGIFKEYGEIIDYETLMLTKGSIDKKIMYFKHYYEFKKTNIPIIKMDK